MSISVMMLTINYGNIEDMKIPINVKAEEDMQ